MTSSINYITPEQFNQIFKLQNIDLTQIIPNYNPNGDFMLTSPVNLDEPNIEPTESSTEEFPIITTDSSVTSEDEEDELTLESTTHTKKVSTTNNNLPTHQGVSNVEQSVEDSVLSNKTNSTNMTSNINDTTTMTKIYSNKSDHHANTVDNAVLCRTGLIEDICGVPEIRPKRALDDNRFESLFDLVNFLQEAEGDAALTEEEEVEPSVTLDEEHTIVQQLPEEEVTATELSEDAPTESNSTDETQRSGVFYRFPCPENDNYGYFVDATRRCFVGKVDTRMVPGSYVPDHIPIIHHPGGFFSLPLQEVLYSSTDPSPMSEEALLRRRVTFNNFTQERRVKDGVNEDRRGLIMGTSDECFYEGDLQRRPKSRFTKFKKLLTKLKLKRVKSKGAPVLKSILKPSREPPRIAPPPTNPNDVFDFWLMANGEPRFGRHFERPGSVE
ncbi:hypothetical protein I9W82_003158 [Candida metapsilosis]|uniref:Uncharacterized protein n=1 Tax=Candida metapsilosis TaxID=273372 RepID=A0A8H8DD18_9ASCO|nr:hypothetical protein I9W82_003158 [Candida metapsilosis]